MNAITAAAEPSVYLSPAETAKLVRAALKNAFPGVKFSVKSSKGSVRVGWVDGPLQKAVDAVAGAFQGARFDGMIDMGYNVDMWLLPDGTAMVASSPGTQGSMGLHEAVENAKPHPDARVIRNSAYVFCSREHSADLLARAEAWVQRRGGWEGVWRAQGASHAVWLVCNRATIGAGNTFIVQKDH